MDRDDAWRTRRCSRTRPRARERCDDGSTLNVTNAFEISAKLRGLTSAHRDFRRITGLGRARRADVLGAGHVRPERGDGGRPRGAHARIERANAHARTRRLGLLRLEAVRFSARAPGHHGSGGRQATDRVRGWREDVRGVRERRNLQLSQASSQVRVNRGENRERLGGVAAIVQASRTEVCARTQRYFWFRRHR